MKLEKIVKYLDTELALDRFASDVSNNGLQIEACSEVNKIVFGVDGCLELFEAAADCHANMVIVHHGISWGGNPKRFSGYTARRLQLMFQHNISLYAAHLPLDAHPVLGNNAQLCKMLNLTQCEEFFEYAHCKIGFIGRLPHKMLLKDIAAIFEDRLDTKGKLHGDNDSPVSKIAIVSGGGGMDSLEQAGEAGADLLITGEFCHEMYHLQQELALPVLSLGHYASETVGVKALMENLSSKFGVETEFIDIPTGL
ncbi:MAG: Nif3-like dinuclear metal center hexameric protein [Lentisphaeria bacterium]|nr:Nif3-like dinuclear metal center hexameric protein [Lentisphaeria bacterium]